VFVRNVGAVINSESPPDAVSDGGVVTIRTRGLVRSTTACQPRAVDPPPKLRVICVIVNCAEAALTSVPAAANIISGMWQ
jgi:hypothetical protein